METIQKAKNNQKVKGSPRPSFIIGKRRVTMKLAAQLERVAIDAARPRILLGYISEIITHTTGPKEAAKLAIYMRMKIKIHGPLNAFN